MKTKKRTSTGFMIVVYIVCIFLAILSLFPFMIMIV
ncbi:MAG: carbohydrate ABC transporter permease, partial [Clostridia bacterium]|nr:carbohydrate ABC transporter permease [Clostridia bacterium]